jgi:transcriptional regulator with XRE-family HTH domain
MASNSKHIKQIESVYAQFGERIESVRKTLGLTQDELGKRIGHKRASISNIEAGRQRILLHDVEKFAQAFATTPKILLRGIWL